MYAAVHGVKPKFTSKQARAARAMLGPETEKSFNEIVPFFGEMASGIPDEIKESIRIAEELKKKMKIN